MSELVMERAMLAWMLKDHSYSSFSSIKWLYVELVRNCLFGLICRTVQGNLYFYTCIMKLVLVLTHLAQITPLAYFKSVVIKFLIIKNTTI